MANRNAPGCGQVFAACALIIVGTLGGCTVGALSSLSPLSNTSFYAWLAGGVLVGAFLAALVLRRPRE